jgi:hypothetical protein
MAPTPIRPRQVTLAGWMIMLGSGIVVLSAFERVSGLRSIESQETVEKFLAKPPGEGLGLSVDEVLNLIQLLSLVAAACATAAAILGFWVLKGSKQARFALAILAVPLVLTGLATGGLISALVAAAAVMLWLQPARNWFEGKPPPEPPAMPELPTAATLQQPPPMQPPGQSPVQSPVPPYPQPYGQPFGQPYGQQVVPWPHETMVRQARPPAVVGACVLTWACAAAVVLGLGATVLAMLLAPDVLFEELHRQNPDLSDQGLSDSEIRTATYLCSALIVPWCLVAAGFAIQAFRGRRWARLALLICASVAGMLSLVAVFASAITVIPFVACVATVALLSRPEVRAWYDARP